jgi:cytochrome bd-type quinol oxidase subunit 2
VRRVRFRRLPAGDRDQQQALAKALLASALVGTGIFAVVQYALFPFLARELTAGQLAWLRAAFLMHTAWFLFAVLLIAAVLGLPVLLVCLWMFRRMQPSQSRLSPTQSAPPGSASSSR